MQPIHFAVPVRLALIVGLTVVGGACLPNNDPVSATGGSSGATGGAGMPPATGGSTNPGTGGNVTATGGTGTLPGTGGATGGSSNSGTGGDALGTGGTDGTGSGGAGGRGQSTGGAIGTSNGGTSGGGCGAAAFCDDFERSTMLGTEWMLDNTVTANTIQVDSTQHHSGMNALHIKYGTAAMATYVSDSKGFPFPNDSFWGRVWMYAMTGPETGHHVFIETRNGAQTDQSGVRELNTQTPSILATNLQSSDASGKSTVPLPQGKWACFEWQVKATGGTGEVHLYMDGTEVPGTAKTGWKIPNLMRQRIGIQRYSAGTAGELWYDDFAVGTARIGCN